MSQQLHSGCDKRDEVYTILKSPIVSYQDGQVLHHFEWFVKNIFNNISMTFQYYRLLDFW